MSKDLDEIYCEYKSKIKLPKQKFYRKFLLCPVGGIGAGKTTVIKPLAEKLGVARVSTDEVRELLKANGRGYDGDKDIAARIVRDLLQEGYSIALDGNCGSPDALERIQGIVKDFAPEVFWLHVAPPEKFIIQKLKNYRHTWLFSSGDDAVAAYFKYKKNNGDFSNLKLPYIYTFDTSREDLPEQIDEAASLICKKLEK